MEKFESVAGIREKNNFYAEFKEKLKNLIDTKEVKAMKLNEEMAIGFYL